MRCKKSEWILWLFVWVRPLLTFKVLLVKIVSFLAKNAKQDIATKKQIVSTGKAQCYAPVDSRFWNSLTHKLTLLLYSLQRTKKHTAALDSIYCVKYYTIVKIAEIRCCIVESVAKSVMTIQGRIETAS